MLIGGLAILSLLSPFDLLPDFVPYLGRLDDLVALVGTYWILRRRWHVLMGRRSSSSRQRQEEARRADNNWQHQRATAETDRVAPLTPWQVLGVRPDASPEEIHTAYKKQLLQYHPDRVAHLGEELQQLAYRKTLAIQEAYKRLQQH